MLPTIVAKFIYYRRLTVAPEPTGFTGLAHPDLVIALAPEGFRELESRGLFTPPGAARRYVLDATRAAPAGIPVERRDLRGRYGPRGAALGALAEEIGRAGWWDRRAWQAAIDLQPRGRREELTAVIGKAM